MPFTDNPEVAATQVRAQPDVVRVDTRYLADVRHEGEPGGRASLHDNHADAARKLREHAGQSIRHGVVKPILIIRRTGS